MPGLKKTTLDIPILAGLSQKIDPRKLPPGAAAKALNLVVDKRGRAVKRLGYFPLPSADPADPAPAFSQGVALGTWQDNLVAIGRTVAGGVTSTLLKTYSDDLGGPVCRGPVPELKVVSDAIVANTAQCATSTTTAAVGDIQVEVWIATGSNASTPPFKGQIWWQAIERSTGDLVVPAQPLQANTGLATNDVRYVRLAVVGGTFVLCHDTNATVKAIGCFTMTTAALESGAGWTPKGDLAGASNVASYMASVGSPFDMRAAAGDATHFLLAWEVDRGNVQVEQRLASAPATVVATWAAEPSEAAVGKPVFAFALRADQTASNRLLLAYVKPTTSGPPPFTYTVKAASALYPAMTSSNTPAVIYTSSAPASSDSEQPPTWLDVTFGGAGGTTTGLATWTITHSPYCCAWNAAAVALATPLRFQAPGLVVSSSFAALPAMSDARIIQNMVHEGIASIVNWGNMAGANAAITRGLVLASRGVEANGIAYFLGWVPSSTQGAFVILAHDFAQNPNGGSTGGSTPMRPVGTLQLRTCNAPPGLGFGSSNSTPSPNSWTGGSEWSMSGDHYGTAWVAYIGGTMGQRLQPALGGVQTTPRTGFPMTQWGSLTAIGGALPGVFDGQNFVEQGYLYVPESIFCVVNPTAGGGTQGPTWTADNDAYSWIFCWEHFDAQGNFHPSARSATLTVTGAQLKAGGVAAYPFTPQTATPIRFFIPTLGATMRQYPPNINGVGYALPAAPAAAPTLGAYRTTRNGLIFLRITDRYFNGADPAFAAPPSNTFAADSIVFTDNVSDNNLGDGTHPQLYGDGTNGAPGALDNFCPPATNVMVRHRERLFIAPVQAPGQVRFTKVRSTAFGSQSPGYQEQVMAFSVGGADPVTGLESLDGNLIALKAHQLFGASGPGPADDGSGALFSTQPIPTDLGCVRPEGVKATPEGVYFQSTAGLRKVSRALLVEYAGGPVEDELSPQTGFPNILGAILYPQNNRVIFLAAGKDYAGGTGQLSGELLVRDYVLDAWTTGQVVDGGLVHGAVAAAVANAVGGLVNFTYSKPTLHLMMADGTVWREHFPEDVQAYFDNATYVSWTWLSPVIRKPGTQQSAASDQGRFRLWDIIMQLASQDPHGISVAVGTDYGAPTLARAWTWDTPGQPQIAPGGVVPTPLTQLRAYHGLMGEGFQVLIQDVSDPASVSGQGAQLLGLTLGIGLYEGPYKLPSTATQ